VRRSSNDLFMDGFVQSNSALQGSSNKIVKISENTNLAKIGPITDRLKSTAQNVHKRAQRSQTLMRTAVSKPAVDKNKIERKAARTITAVKSERSQSVAKHPNVNRFGHVAAALKPVQNVNPSQKALVPAAKTQEPQRAAAHSVAPSMVTSASHQHLERLLDEALTKADAHKRIMKRQIGNKNIWNKIKFAPRWLSLGAGTLIVLLLSGFYAWQNVPQVAIKLAAARSNISAKVPAYTPSGFSFAGPINYSKGSVSIRYAANDDGNRSFTLIQEKSKMSNKSLEDTVVPADTQVQTSQVAGTTVYIYGDNNDAAWVNHGIKYHIQDFANLNSDQLLKIAESL
jgi:hypothetical protein